MHFDKKTLKTRLYNNCSFNYDKSFQLKSSTSMILTFKQFFGAQPIIQATEHFSTPFLLRGFAGDKSGVTRGHAYSGELTPQIYRARRSVITVEVSCKVRTQSHTKKGVPALPTNLVTHVSLQLPIPPQLGMLNLQISKIYI
jgi:hypothetical protein